MEIILSDIDKQLSCSNARQEIAFHNLQKRAKKATIVLYYRWREIGGADD